MTRQISQIYENNRIRFRQFITWWNEASAFVVLVTVLAKFWTPSRLFWVSDFCSIVLQKRKQKKSKCCETEHDLSRPVGNWTVSNVSFLFSEKNNFFEEREKVAQEQTSVINWPTTTTSYGGIVLTWLLCDMALCNLFLLQHCHLVNFWIYFGWIWCWVWFSFINNNFRMTLWMVVVFVPGIFVSSIVSRFLSLCTVFHLRWAFPDRCFLSIFCLFFVFLWHFWTTTSAAQRISKWCSTLLGSLSVDVCSCVCANTGLVYLIRSEQKHQQKAELNWILTVFFVDCMCCWYQYHDSWFGVHISSCVPIAVCWQWCVVSHFQILILLDALAHIVALKDFGEDWSVCSVESHKFAHCFWGHDRCGCGALNQLAQLFWMI